MIEIDPTAIVSSLADIEDSTRGTIIKIGEGARVDSFVKIKPAGGVGNLSIGRNSTINSGCVFYTGNGISIGENVAIAANCTLAPVNHAYSRADIPIIDQGFCETKGGIIIEDDVWIGAGCVILDGTILRTGCVIAAMSLVRGEVAKYSVRGGNPLRLLGGRE